MNDTNTQMNDAHTDVNLNAQTDTDDGATTNTDSSPNWIEGLSDELKSNEVLSEYKDNLPGFVETALKDRNELAELRDSIPSVPDAYDFNTEGLDVDAVGKWGVKAKELGLTQEQAAGTVEFQKEMFQAMQQEMIDNENKLLDQLKSEWGSDFEPNMGKAQQLLTLVTSDEFTKLLEETRLGNHPTVIKHFFELSKKISEDSFITGDGPTGDKRQRTEDGTPVLTYDKSNMPQQG